MSTDVTELTIKSRDRLSTSTSSANAKFYMGNPLCLTGKTQVELSYLLCYNSVYNIITGVNDALPFYDGGVAKNATVAPGFYTPTSLATALQTALNAVSSGYTVVASTTTRLLTFSNAGAFQLQFLSGAASKTSCWKECGYSDASGTKPVDSVSGVSTTSPYIVQLSYPLSLYIQIGEFGSRGLDSNGTWYTFCIPDAVISGNAIEFKALGYWKQSIAIDEKKFGSRLSNLSVRFVNPVDGSDAPLLNSDWQMVLTVR